MPFIPTAKPGHKHSHQWPQGDIATHSHGHRRPQQFPGTAKSLAYGCAGTVPPEHPPSRTVPALPSPRQPPPSQASGQDCGMPWLPPKPIPQDWWLAPRVARSHILCIQKAKLQARIRRRLVAIMYPKRKRAPAAALALCTQNPFHSKRISQAPHFHPHGFAIKSPKRCRAASRLS